MNPLVIAFAVVGGIWGVVADRIATRWPEHDEPELPGDRPPGWRTVVNGTIGAVALGTLPGRFDDTTELVLFGAWFLVLTLLLATDLDQRLLPSAITLPLIALTLVAAVSGVDPLVHDAFGVPGAIAIAVVIPLGMYLISIPFGVDAVGQGDLILLVSVGLFEGARAHDHGPRRGCVPRRRRHRRADAHPPGDPPDVHPVRPVPHRRGVLGRPRAVRDLNGGAGAPPPLRRARPARSTRPGHRGSMPPNLSRPGAVPASGRRITSQRSRHSRREVRERSLLAVTTPA